MGIDVGTFETKGILVDDQGNVHGRARRRHGISTPAQGFVEQDADAVWWADFTAVSQELMLSEVMQSGTVEAVGCSGIGPCVLPVDESLRPLRPGILYGVDTRAGSEIEMFRQRLGEREILRRTGNELSSQSAGPKIAWIIAHEPEVAARTRWYMSSSSYLVAKLTGRVTLDHATAGYFHPFYDLSLQEWDISGCEDLVRLEQLPELGWSTDIAGQVTAEASAATGLPVGVPVSFGSTDAPAEAVSASVLHDGDLMLMYGSSTYMIKVTASARTGGVLWSAPYVFPQTFVLAAGTSTAGTLTRWISEVLGLDSSAGDEVMFGQLMALARQSPPGSRGLLMLPHFSGERTPVHDATSRGVLMGLSLEHTRPDIARAVLEGVAHSIAHAFSAYAAVDEAPKRIMAVGGGTKNQVLTRSVSTITGLPQTVVNTDGAALGDAALAALGVGAVANREDLGKWVPLGEVVEPDSEHAAGFRVDHEDYRELYSTMASLSGKRTRRFNAR